MVWFILRVILTGGRCGRQWINGTLSDVISDTRDVIKQACEYTIYYIHYDILTSWLCSVAHVNESEMVADQIIGLNGSHESRMLKNKKTITYDKRIA